LAIDPRRAPRSRRRIGSRPLRRRADLPGGHGLEPTDRPPAGRTHDRSMHRQQGSFVRLHGEKDAVGSRRQTCTATPMVHRKYIYFHICVMMKTMLTAFARGPPEERPQKLNLFLYIVY